MLGIPVKITRLLSSDFPGFVECSFVDAFGQTHLFVDKIPVVCTDDFASPTNLPSIGAIACTIKQESVDSSGRSVAIVSTMQPWSIESTLGASDFTVFASDLIDQ